jgi:4-hydroxy-tetrahydrodipicolinate synthase
LKRLIIFQTKKNTQDNFLKILLVVVVDLMMQAGSTGIVPLGSLGETATLSFDEKRAVLRTVVKAVAGRGAVVPGVAALATADAVRFAQMAADEKCSGLMVLPPYVYSTDWREMKAHVSAVIAATPLPCMLYINLHMLLQSTM